MSVEVSIVKKLGDFKLDVSFSAGDEVTGLLGVSGSGKSMTLRCIAGIEKPDSGRIVVDGEVYFDSEKKINRKSKDRNVGYLFQNYALFPNMSVKENIIIGLEKTKDIEARLKEQISIFQLDGLEDRHPGRLSGGQQQRVALARIFIRKPKILMLDEPFSALDTTLRWELQKETIEILKHFKGTVLFVSHSRDEIYRMCKKAGVVEKGQIASFGEVKTLFSNPDSVSVLKLTGCKNISKIHWLDEDTCFAEDWGLELKCRGGRSEGVDAVGIRAHYFEAARADDVNAFEIDVENSIKSQFMVSVLFRPKGTGAKHQLCWDFDRVGPEEELGEIFDYPRYLKIAPERIYLVKGET